MSSNDGTEKFELLKRNSIGDRPSSSEATLLLSHLQQSVRLLSGDLKPGDLHQVLSKIESETAALAPIFKAGDLPVMSMLTTAVGKLVRNASREGKSLDASTLRTLTNAFDFLRSYNADKGNRVKLQSLPIHVLALDDDPLYRKIIELALKDEFINLVLCGTAEDALIRLKIDYFDVVISDISMPEVDGFSFIRRLREIKMHANTPVIFVTGLDDLLTRSKSRLTGGCDFITKQVRPAELSVKVITFAWKSRLARNPAASEPTSPALPLTPPRSGGKAPEERQTPSQLGVVSINLGGRVKSINKEAATMLGYSAEELLDTEAGQFLFVLDQAGKAKRLDAHRLGRLAGQAQRATSIPVLAQRKTSEKCPLQMKISRSGAGEAALFVCLLTADSKSTGSLS
jgi:DNA-binding response OmpR family regulator